MKGYEIGDLVKIRKDTMRRGEAYWNYLFQTSIDLTNNMLGTRLDPTYDDRRLEEFLEYVKRNW